MDQRKLLDGDAVRCVITAKNRGEGVVLFQDEESAHVGGGRTYTVRWNSGETESRVDEAELVPVV